MNGRAALLDPAAARRLALVLKAAFIVSAILFLYIVIKIPAKMPQLQNPSLEMAMTIIALTMIVLGFAFPNFLAKVAQRAPGNTIQAVRMQGWILRNVIGFAFLEACSLFGVALHFLGAELLRSELLISVGIVATVFFSAGTLPGSEEGASASS